ncbi:hypothetical protein Ddye_028075 [Dipteronia dyeriana]|uniref:Uncharacterized protein n=1 Tax=Dipteronia dyeriana TaxID=168575 RepID=A0AAD9TQA6_9ROSI|nr:hypothetical protein Ddye_028075 [Dipteronia dyeriana]
MFGQRRSMTRLEAMFQKLLEQRPNLNTYIANAPASSNRDGVEGVSLGRCGGGRLPRAAIHEQFKDLSDEDSDEDFEGFPRGLIELCQATNKQKEKEREKGERLSSLVSPNPPPLSSSTPTPSLYVIDIFFSYSQPPLLLYSFIEAAAFARRSRHPYSSTPPSCYK